MDPSGSLWLARARLDVACFFRNFLRSAGELIRRRVHLGSCRFHSSALIRRRVDSGSRGFTWARLGVTGFILATAHVKVARFVGSLGGGGTGRKVHSGSGGDTRAREMVAGFIRVRMGSLRCEMVALFIRVRLSLIGRA